MFHVTSRSDGVSLLKMDDGKVNAIGPDFLTGFRDAWRDAAGDGRAVVLAGNAKAFSGGLDLKVLPTLGRDELVTFFRGFVRMLVDVYAYPAPTVAAVDGPALAGGAFLAQCCDVRLFTSNVRIGYTEVLVGIPFPKPVLDLAKAELPPEEVGPAILQATVREGEDAVRRGWGHRFTERESVVDDAIQEAETLVGHSARAYASAKAGLREPLANEVALFEKQGAEAYVDDLVHPETISAIVSYFEKVRAKR